MVLTNTPRSNLPLMQQTTNTEVDKCSQRVWSKTRIRGNTNWKRTKRKTNKNSGTNPEVEQSLNPGFGDPNCKQPNQTITNSATNPEVEHRAKLRNQNLETQIQKMFPNVSVEKFVLSRSYRPKIRFQEHLVFIFKFFQKPRIVTITSPVLTNIL